MHRNAARTLACLPIMLSAYFASAQLPNPVLVGYWHNWNDVNAPFMELDQVDPRYNVLEVAFAEPTAGTTYAMEFTPSMTTPSTFAAHVAAHQANGNKVLISVGGATSTVLLNDPIERDQFVSSMMDILSTYGFDGMDIDLEGASVMVSGGTIDMPVDQPIVLLIDAIRSIMAQYRAQFGRKMLLTMAPETAFVQGGQSAYGGIWGAYLPIVHALRDSMDLLQVQLYNSGSMFGVDGSVHTQGTSDFIVSQTEAVILGFGTNGGPFLGMPAEKVAVALPACASAAGGGYVDTTQVRAAMEYLLGYGAQPGSYSMVQATGHPLLRGMMTWSVNWDAAQSCDGPWSYAENFQRIFAPNSTAIVDHDEDPLTVYPIPTEDGVTMQCDAFPFGSLIDVRWSEVTGRTVRRETRVASPYLELSVKDLDPGLYVLEVVGRSQRRSQRVVVH